MLIKLSDFNKVYRHGNQRSDVKFRKYGGSFPGFIRAIIRREGSPDRGDNKYRRRAFDEPYKVDKDNGRATKVVAFERKPLVNSKIGVIYISSKIFLFPLVILVIDLACFIVRLIVFLSLSHEIP